MKLRRIYFRNIIMKFRFFLCRQIQEIHSYRKIFREINSLVKTLLSRNFCQKCVREDFCNLHTTVWKNEKFGLTEKIFRQINSSNFLSKNVAFTKFLPKMCKAKSQQFPQRAFHSVTVWNFA